MPELSLLVPLEDARGEAVDHLRTWTHEQSLDRERYQVVIASPHVDPEDEEGIEELLAPQDVLEHVPGAGLMELWNAAAARAASDWLVLTENHCEGDPACLASVARAIEANGDRDALTLDHGHITPNAYSERNARWFDGIYEGWDEPGEWPRLNLVGFAIRRRVFHEVGGLDPRYGVFSSPLLAARLHRRGGRVAHVPEAHVLHVHPEEIGAHHAYSMNYARGECEARTREDRVFCESYFGHARIWTNRLSYEPHVARQGAVAIAHSAARAVFGRRSELPWLLRELGGWLAAAAAGPRPQHACATLLFRVCELAASRGFVHPGLAWWAFLRAQDKVLERTQLTWVHERLGSASAPPPWSGRRAVEELGPDELVGVHGLERAGERWFRWGEPVTMLRLAAAREARTLRVETVGLRGPGADGPRAAYVDGRRVRPDGLHWDGAALTVPLPQTGGRGTTTVTLLTRPLAFEPSAPRDDRRLGLPIVSIAV